MPEVVIDPKDLFWPIIGTLPLLLTWTWKRSRAGLNASPKLENSNMMAGDRPPALPFKFPEMRYVAASGLVTIGFGLLVYSVALMHMLLTAAPDELGTLWAQPWIPPVMFIGGLLTLAVAAIFRYAK